MLQQTIERVSGERFAPAIIVSGEELHRLLKEQLSASNVPIEAMILEPVGRNTAAAAGLAAAWLDWTSRDELLLLMPADHDIADRQSFINAVEAGVPEAEKGAIVTFGAQPTEPNTQYGYIEADPNDEIAPGTYRIARFHEKPSAEKASEYIASGNFYWNCGIFLAKSSVILDELGKHLRPSAAAIKEAVRRATTDGVTVQPAQGPFEGAESISIDHAIMEKTDRGVVVPVSMQWSDVGGWNAVWKLGQKDSDGNVRTGNIVAIDTRNSLLRSDGTTVIAAIGLENQIVIAVDGAILVAPIDRAAEVKDILGKLEGGAET